MLRTLSCCSILALALISTGCGDNNIVANSTVKSGTYYAETGITGSANVVTIERGSRLSKLSIIGDGNEVEVQDGVRLPMVEIWGSDNTISVPHDMLVQINEVGHRNQLIRRPGIEAAPQAPIMYETRPRPVDVTIRQQQEVIDPYGNVESSRTYETTYISPTDPADNPESTIQELRRITPPIETTEPPASDGSVETDYETDYEPMKSIPEASDVDMVETDYEPMKSQPQDSDDDDDLTPLK
jgi:hypothetical protein